tara:strand:+ start:3188 stop:3886 length:699 start_codon:yes stop_codon:yes gene_type:complete
MKTSQLVVKIIGIVIALNFVTLGVKKTTKEYQVRNEKNFYEGLNKFIEANLQSEEFNFDEYVEKKMQLLDDLEDSVERITISDAILKGRIATSERSAKFLSMKCYVKFPAKDFIPLRYSNGDFVRDPQFCRTLDCSFAGGHCESNVGTKFTENPSQDMGNWNKWFAIHGYTCTESNCFYKPDNFLLINPDGKIRDVGDAAYKPEAPEHMKRYCSIMKHKSNEARKICDQYSL